jgi:hypothetical protein
MLDRLFCGTNISENLHSNLLEGVRWIFEIENKLNEGCGEGNSAGLQSNDNEAVDNAFGRTECGFELCLEELRDAKP